MSREGSCQHTEPLMGNMNDTQRSANVCTKQQRIAQIAREHPKEKLTALNHYLDIPWLEEAFQRVRKDSAPGVDGQTVAEYEKHLESNLKDLLSRAKDGSYQAPPVKRVYIPKGDDPKETRPIGIPTTENKVLERGVVMILEPIYEEEFRNFSYGFRPGRSCHQALSAFWNQASGMGVQWVLEVDIRKYFDSVVWSNLMEIVGKRIGDGVILRLISKWLHAGVMDKGELRYPEAGTLYYQKTRLTMENGSSRGFAVVIVEHSAQFVATADAAQLEEARRRLPGRGRSFPRRPPRTRT